MIGGGTHDDDQPRVEEEPSSYYLNFADDPKSNKATKILVEPDPYAQMSSKPTDSVMKTSGMKRRVPSDSRYLTGHDEEDMKVMLVMPNDDDNQFPQMPRDHLSNQNDFQSEAQPYFGKSIHLTCLPELRNLLT